MIELYQRVKLKNGKDAVIVEILGKGEAYIADIEISEGDYETETIYPKEIKSVFVEVEQPFLIA
jgi:hypothetical protein